MVPKKPNPVYMSFLTTLNSAHIAHNNGDNANNPILSMIDMADLIPYQYMKLLEHVNWKKELFSLTKHDLLHILKMFFRTDQPSLLYQANCMDMITGSKVEFDSQLQNVLVESAQLAMLAYALPVDLPHIVTRLFGPSEQFMYFIEHHLPPHTRQSYRQLDACWKKSCKSLKNGTYIDGSWEGFYIRTPLHVWDQKGQLVTELPDWKHRDKLSEMLVIGNNVAHVYRQQIGDSKTNSNSKSKFRCFVLFRGTTDEFNSASQYGTHMNRTQLYRLPEFDPITRRHYANGSTRHPCFFFNYVAQVENLSPAIYDCLARLDAWSDQCEEVVVTGHSMGGALTLVFEYLCFHHHRDLWNKCLFRSIAAPMCCNAAAIQVMEQRCIDSGQKNKHVEFLNTDDFINIQYQLGETPLHIQKTILNGKHAVGAFLLEFLLRQGLATLFSSHAQSIQDAFLSSPETFLSAFLYGALQKQVKAIPSDERACFRMGQRHAELERWGTSELKHIYEKSLRLVHCQRHIDLNSEFLGKSHAIYGGVNTIPCWSRARAYEKHLYSRMKSVLGYPQRFEPWVVPVNVPINVPLNLTNHQKANLYCKPNLPYGLPKTAYQSRFPPME